MNTGGATDLVFLIDVDNTLLDNDRLISDLMDAYRPRIRHQPAAIGIHRYSKRSAPGSATSTIWAPCSSIASSTWIQQRLLGMSSFLIDYPFAQRLYPDALQVLAHLQTLGSTVILSDGENILQPRKIQQSGIWDAVQGRVLIYVHKEQMLQDVERCYPARHYVMIDDKLRILDSLRRQWQPARHHRVPASGPLCP